MALLGGLLIAGGVARRMWLPGFFKVWGRIEMGLLAEFQFYAYGAGMLLASIHFADPSPHCRFSLREKLFFAERKTTLRLDPSPDVSSG